MSFMRDALKGAQMRDKRFYTGFEPRNETACKGPQTQRPCIRNPQRFPAPHSRRPPKTRTSLSIRATARTDSVLEALILYFLPIVR